MLTPAFSITQSKQDLTVVIKAPFARITDTEIFIEDTEFRFFSQPYFLRLNLPGCIVENGSESAKYDSDTGSFTIKVPKQTPGEEFEGLDMLTTLLTPKCQKLSKQCEIEVIGKEDVQNDDMKDEVNVTEEFDWHIEQHPYKEEAISLDAPKYGFAIQRSGVFKLLKDEVYELVDIKDPDSVPASERRQLRMEAEDTKFDPEYYLGDFHEDSAIQDVMKYEPQWNNKGVEPQDDTEFTDEENETMKNLPRKEYLLDIDTETAVYLGLVDILCAYAYNVRTTEGENNVESAWTVCKLSSILSWFESFKDLKEVALSFTRRSLCYPLYRNWNLTMTVLKDTAHILCKGKRTILRILLEIHSMFNETYPRYILNDLYIKDYCVWIQSTSNDRLKSLGTAFQKISPQKSEVGIDLCALEHLAVDDVTSLSTAMAAVKIHNAETDSDEEDDSGDEDGRSDEDNDSGDEDGSSDEDNDSVDEKGSSESDEKICSASDNHKHDVGNSQSD